MMSEETYGSTDGKDRSVGRNVSTTMIIVYMAMLIVSLLVLLVGIHAGSFLKVFITGPVIFILVGAVMANRKTVHMPPLMIFILIGLMAAVIAGKFLYDYETPSGMVVDGVFGILLGLCGLILAYSFVPMLFDARENNAVNALFVSISIALAIYVIWLMIQYYTGQYLGIDELPIRRDFGVADSTKVIMDHLVCVITGILLISISFYLGRNSTAIKGMMSKHLMHNSATVGTEEFERNEIKKALASGESETVEYKSTLRTDLNTGEKEERIERSVLKSLVAFLNSDGGTILIGVSDDGRVIGIDKSFESSDKANLHLTNLITTHIGNEYLPYISFGVTEYGGKRVMRVFCKKSSGPVFLKEWPHEYFYVRSGSASMELNGMALVNYINNHFKKKKKN